MRLDHGAGHAEGKIERAAAEIRSQVQGRRRLRPGTADSVQRADQSEIVEIVSGGLRQRTRLSPSGHAAVNETRVALERHVRPEPEPFHRAGAKTFDQRGGLGDEVAGEHEAVGMFQIERHGGTRALQECKARRNIQAQPARSQPVQPDDVDAAVSG